MKHHLAESPSDKRKRSGPSIEGVSGQQVEMAVDRIKRFQSMEKIAGKMEDFPPGVDVEVAMSKDVRKRPGAERGEDMFLADKETGLTGVFDGLGQGREGGTEAGRGADASSTAASAAPSLYTVIRKHFEKSDKDLDIGLSVIAGEQASLEHPSIAEKTAARLQNEWKAYDPAVKKEILSLFQTAKKLSEVVKNTGGMSTATIGKTVQLPGGRMFEVIANVGDSGAMRIGADGLSDMVTQPDSAVDYLLSHGTITPEQAKDPNFTIAGKTIKKLKTAMYQALGNPDTPVVPRMAVIELMPGDEIDYVSDGIIDEFTDEDGDFDLGKATAILARKGATSETLVDAASKEGGKDKQDEKTVLRKKRPMELGADDLIEN